MRKIYRLIFRYIGTNTPEGFRKIRNFLVRKYIASCGTGISIGRKSKIHKNTVLGDYSGIGFGCETPNGVLIGNNVMMGPNVLFYTQNHCTKDICKPMRTQGMSEIKPIVIEDDVWIGARVCILPGVTVGKGSIIGACAVVAKDIPPYSVAVGNPVRIVKDRRSH